MFCVQSQRLFRFFFGGRGSPDPAVWEVGVFLPRRVDVDEKDEELALVNLCLYWLR